MGKFSLGLATTVIGAKMNKKDLYVSDDMNWLQKDVEKQYNNIIDSLNIIENIMKKVLNSDELSKSARDNIKGWSQKCSSQVSATKKRLGSFHEKLEQDRNDYKISLLDKRIEALEKKIASMEI